MFKLLLVAVINVFKNEEQQTKCFWKFARDWNFEVFNQRLCPIILVIFVLILCWLLLNIKLNNDWLNECFNVIDRHLQSLLSLLLLLLRTFVLTLLFLLKLFLFLNQLMFSRFNLFAECLKLLDLTFLLIELCLKIIDLKRFLF